MNEREALEYAKSGRANYATDRRLTLLGNDGMWKLNHVGEVPCTPYVMQGGFQVTTEAVWESVLTEKGEQRLAQLQADEMNEAKWLVEDEPDVLAKFPDEHGPLIIEKHRPDNQTNHTYEVRQVSPMWNTECLKLTEQMARDLVDALTEALGRWMPPVPDADPSAP